MIKEILKSIIAGIIIGIGIILTLFLFYVCWSYISWGADLSPSIKTFAMCSGRNWSLGCDTSFEATHFDYMFVNKFDTTLVNTYKSYNPDFKIIQYMLMQTWVSNEEPYDSLISHMGADSENAFIHFQNNVINDVYNYDIGSLHFFIFSGWDTLNDTVGGADGIRDFFAYASLSTSHSSESLIDTTQSWTANEWSDSGFAVYGYYGGFVGLIDSNNSNTLYWTFSGDTSNIATNGGFEYGNFTGFDSLKGCVDSVGFYIDGDSVHSGSYSARIVHKCEAPSQPTWLVFKINNPDTLTIYNIDFWFKTTDSLTWQVNGWGATSSSYGIRMSNDSLDGEWHHYTYSFSNLGADSLQVWIGFQTSYGGHYGDSAWIDDFQIISHEGLLVGSEHFLDVYGYSIADTHSVNNRASAMTKFDSRVICEYWSTKKKYDINIGDSLFKDFFVNNWLPFLIDKYSNYDGFMVDNTGLNINEVANDWQTLEYSLPPANRNDLWASDIYTIFGLGKDTCANHNFILTANVIPPHDSGLGNNLHGLLDEGAFSPYYFHAHSWDSWRDNLTAYGQNARDEGWLRISYLDGIGTLQFIMEGYHNYLSTEDTNTLKMASLTHYYCIAGDSTYFQSEWATTWESNLTGQWFGALEFDIGSPVDTCYLVQNDVDVDGDSFLVVGRKFSGSTEGGVDTVLVLFKPSKAGINTYTPDTTTTLITLDGLWVRLTANGGSDSDFDGKNLRLQYGEGAILIKLPCD